jgi:predicted esterase YcpF (UPF0227 family)
VLIYIHGFNSSAQSYKAGLLRERMAASGLGSEYACPELSHRPAQAIAQLETLIAGMSIETTALVGSSLGGFYASWLTEKYRLRTVLVNPAVRPWELLHDYLGPQTNLYTGVEYQLTAIHLEELRALEVPTISPERYLLLVRTGDEVLDYRRSVARFRGCRQLVIAGGDHGFGDFGDYLDAVFEFCGIDI